MNPNGTDDFRREWNPPPLEERDHRGRTHWVFIVLALVFVILLVVEAAR
jgi:hypothetical protein